MRNCEAWSATSLSCEEPVYAIGGCALSKGLLSNQLTCTSAGLIAGTSAATSALSAAATFQGLPSIMSVAASGSTTARVKFTAPTSDGGSPKFTCATTNAVGTSLAFARSGPDTPVKTYGVRYTGPSGGTVFHVFASGFTCAPDLMSTCSYLEAAPSNSGTVKWCSNTTTSVAGTCTAIGTWAKNTAAMRTVCTSGAAQTATGTTSGGKTDWYLPSKDELQALYDAWCHIGMTGELWSSSRGAAANNACILYWEDGEVTSPSKATVTSVRAVRGRSSFVVGRPQELATVTRPLPRGRSLLGFKGSVVVKNSCWSAARIHRPACPVISVEIHPSSGESRHRHCSSS